MVNMNIQGVVPFKQQGYRRRINTPYKAGELKDATNVMLVDDVIKVRPRIIPMNADATANPLANMHTFLDTYGEDVRPIARNKTHMYTGNGAGFVREFASVLVPPAPAKSFHFPVAKFKYNDLYYWVTWQWNASTGLNQILMWSTSSEQDSFGDPGISGPTVVFTYTDPNVNFNLFEYRGLFIFKERVWIVTNKGIYASKTGDPKVFTPPDGYYLRIRDENINSATAVNDTIYLFCPDSIHALNFGSDPNQDASVRPISQSMGAESCTSYQNTVYAYSNDRVMAISGSSVEVLFDEFSNINLNARSEYNQDGFEGSRLVVWQDHLILIKYSYLSVGGVDSTDRSTRLKVWWPSTGFADYTAKNAIMFNLTNGFVSLLDFRDQILASTDQPTSHGKIVDTSFNEYYGSVNFLTAVQNNSTSYSSYLYQFNIDDIGHPLKQYDYDVIYLEYPQLTYAEPYVSLEVYAYTPDGSEYQIKKFRSVEIQGNVSHADVIIGLDYKPAVLTKSITKSVSTYDGGDNVLLPYRVGINARARAISIKIANSPITDWFAYPATPPVEFKYVLDDIRVLWTYTNRAPINSAVTGSLPMV